MVLSNFNILNILTVWNIKMGKNHLTPNGWQSFQQEKQFIKITKIIK